MKKNKITKIDSIKDYLDFIGSDKEYKAEMQNCEVCGSNNFFQLLSHTDAGNDVLAPLPVQACNKCGFIMQNPRFSKEYYKRFYSEFYPQSRVRSKSNDPDDPKSIGGKQVVTKDGRPTENHYQSAYKRAKYLYSYIKEKGFNIPKKSFLDVGCGCGAFLEYFNDEGFETYGNDPEPMSVEMALEKGIHIDNIPGEEMLFEDEKFGIIIIMGSLEHVHDPNIILKKCWQYLAEDGLLVLQGRFYPVSESFRWLNSNHHRFLTNETIQSIAIKHGFSILESTINPVCGEGTGRKGNGFLFASKSSKNKAYYDKDCMNDLLSLLQENSLVKTPEELKNFINSHDKKFSS